MATFDEINNIPENKPTLSNLIDQKFVQSTTPDGYEQEVINSYNKQFEPKEIGVQGANALYPGMNQPINVGTYSGSIVGNNPIFVPTGDILARDPILARRKAIDDAARARAADLKPYDRPVAPTTVDPHYNKQVYSEFNASQDNIIDRTQKKYGKDWRTILKDKNTKLGKEMANLSANTNFMVKDIDAITNMISSMDEGLLDKTIHLSKSQRKTYNEYKAKIGNFSDLTSLQEANLPEMHKKMRASMDLNNYFNKSGIMKDLKASVDQTYYTGDKGDYYNSITDKKTSYSEIIKDLSKNLAEGTFADEIERGIYTLEDISSGLSARLKDSNERSGKITKKSDKQIAKGEGIIINNFEDSNTPYDPLDPKKTEHPVYDGSGKSTGTFGLDSVLDYNFSFDGGRSPVTINEVDSQGNKRVKKFKGMPISGAEVLQGDGSTRILPGNTLIKAGTLSKGSDGLVYHHATAFVPSEIDKTDKEGKTITRDKIGSNGRPVTESYIENGVKKKRKVKENVKEQIFTQQEVVLIVSRNGKGTGISTQIGDFIEDPKSRDKYKHAVREMGEKSKPREVDEYGMPISN